MLSVVITDPRPKALLAAKRTASIRRLNDHFRQNLPQTDTSHRFVATSGVAALSNDAFAHLLSALRGFKDFTSSNDFHGEHDFGVIGSGSEQFLWKIDYYDQSLENGSPDAADPLVTVRVLTLMRPEEY